MNGVLIDTNIVFDVIERDNRSTTVILREWIKKDFKIIISDHSLYEVLTRINSKEMFDKLLVLINKYKINILYRENSNDFNLSYNDFINGTIKKDKAIKLLVDSYSFSVSSFLANIFSLTTLLLANSLENNYDSYFYNYIREIYRDENVYYKIREDFNLIIKNKYSDNDFKIRNYLKRSLKDMAIRVIIYYEKYSEHLSFKFDKRYNELNLGFKDFKEILCKYCDVDKLKVINKNNMDKYSYIFTREYLYQIVFENRNFDFNTCVDFLNFISAYEKNILYFTNDVKSLNLFKVIFCNENEILEYIKKCEEFKNNIPFAVLV